MRFLDCWRKNELHVHTYSKKCKCKLRRVNIPKRSEQVPISKCSIESESGEVRETEFVGGSHIRPALQRHHLEVCRWCVGCARAASEELQNASVGSSFGRKRVRESRRTAFRLLALLRFRLRFSSRALLWVPSRYFVLNVSIRVIFPVGPVTERRAHRKNLRIEKSLMYI